MLCVYDVLPSQPCLGFVNIRILNRYSFLINWFVCLKFVSKRLAIFSLSYKEHVKVFNPFPLKKLNEYVIWKEKKRIPNIIVWISWTTVSHPLFERLMHSLSGTRPFNMRYSSVLTVTCPVVDRSQLRTNGHKLMHTRYLHDAERTRTGQTAYQRTSNVYPPGIFIRWHPFEVLNMSKTCQRIRPDKTDIT